MGRTSAVRQTMTRPRSPAASIGARPSTRRAASVADVSRRWLGMMSAVSANQYRDNAVSTRPLSGIGVGRATSKALTRSEATMTRRSASTMYRSRTLPDRVIASAASIGGRLSGRGPFGRDERVEARDDLGDVGKVAGVIEARVQIGKAERAGDGRLEREQLAQRPALVRGGHRRSLHDVVGLLPWEAGALDQGHEGARRSVEPEPPIDVLAHPLRPDEEIPNEPRRLLEQVVEQDRGVGQDNPLGRRMADVALVPQRLVLERGRSVAAEDAGEARHALRQDRVALVGHRRGPLLARPERLLDLADLRVLEVADLGREPLEAPAEDGDGGEQRGVA